MPIAILLEKNNISKTTQLNTYINCIPLLPLLFICQYLPLFMITFRQKPCHLTPLMILLDKSSAY